jgi:hypothetical protein
MRSPALTALLALAVVAVLVLAASMVLGMRGGNAPAPVVEADPGIPGRDGIRVEVLNASGLAGVARRGTERLRATGFDVVYYGNAVGFPPDSSVVLDRLGKPEAAAAVGRALGISSVRTAADTTLYLDVTVVLGADWAAASQ